MKTSFSGIIRKIFPIEQLDTVHTCHLWITDPGFDSAEVKAKPQTHKVELVNGDPKVIHKIMQGLKEGDHVKTVVWINSKQIYKRGEIDFNPFIRVKSIEKLSANV